MFFNVKRQIVKHIIMQTRIFSHTCTVEYYWLCDISKIFSRKQSSFWLTRCLLLSVLAGKFDNFQYQIGTFWWIVSQWSQTSRGLCLPEIRARHGATWQRFQEKLENPRPPTHQDIGKCHGKIICSGPPVMFVGLNLNIAISIIHYCYYSYLCYKPTSPTMGPHPVWNYQFLDLSIHLGRVGIRCPRPDFWKRHRPRLWEAKWYVPRREKNRRPKLHPSSCRMFT